jgi:molybdopterin-guanine dinucleotide biosynthesis protein A
MGASKALLPFGPESMLARIARIVAEVARPLTVVAAADQPLPPLSSAVRVVHDRTPQQGPLEGLAAGLAALQGQADRALVVSCDLPLLSAEFLNHLIALAPPQRVAVVASGQRLHPLLGLYPLTILPQVEAQLAAGTRRMTDLLAAIGAVSLDTTIWPAHLRASQVLTNVNTTAQYARALALAGLASSHQLPLAPLPDDEPPPPDDDEELPEELP